MNLLRGIWAPHVLKPAAFRETIATVVAARSFGELRCTVHGHRCRLRHRRRGRLRCQRRGIAPLLDVLAASCALPPCFPPVAIGGRPSSTAGFAGRCRCAGGAHRVRCGGGDPCGSGVRRARHAGGAATAADRPSDTAIGWLMAGISPHCCASAGTGRPGSQRLVWLRPVSDRGATFALERAGAVRRSGISPPCSTRSGSYEPGTEDYFTIAEADGHAPAGAPRSSAT